MSDDIVVRRDDPAVPVVVLNRPARKNAISFAMWRTLGSLYEEFAADPKVRAVVLTGAGDSFCAGADITEFKTLRHDAAAGAVYDEAVRHGTETIANFPKPSVAAISGYCVGGGVALALSCDFRASDRTAKFGVPAARLGIVYSRLECEALVAAVGHVQAKRILFGGERMGAEEALRIGLIDRLVDADPLPAAREIVAPMAANAPLSIAGMKLILNALSTGEADARKPDIAAAVKRALESADYKEGVAAFGEKRPPRFQGR
ncbi:MAG: 3-hydroxybutyryl-CoA dehydratase [Alphaproteobacteria bacterium]|nr:3-hydroxybutyryl-CoA dehydratase [Alphaproteobacteria bacterium]